MFKTSNNTTLAIRISADVESGSMCLFVLASDCSQIEAVPLPMRWGEPLVYRRLLWRVF